MNAPAIPDVTQGATAAAQAVTAAKGLAEQLLASKVTTAEQAQWAIEVAHQVRDQKRGLEAERDTVSKPLRKLATDNTRRWKPAIDTLDRIEKHLKNEAMRFQNAERERQAAALQAATSSAEVADAVAVLAPAPVGLSERVTWGWEVTDPAAVPREYFVLDEARLDREARERKDALAVPGIKPVRKVSGVLR